MKSILSNQGYTLIEVLMAIAIFSIGMMAIGALQTSALMQTGEISRKTRAQNLLTDQVETLKSLPFYANDDGVNNDGDVETDEFDENWDVLTDVDPSEDSSYGHSRTPDDGLYTVHWRVVDDAPIGSQTGISGVPVGTAVTVSKTITVSVTEAGGDPATDSLLTVEFIKVLSESI